MARQLAIFLHTKDYILFDELMKRLDPEHKIHFERGETTTSQINRSQLKFPDTDDNEWVDYAEYTIKSQLSFSNDIYLGKHASRWMEFNHGKICDDCIKSTRVN